MTSMRVERRRSTGHAAERRRTGHATGRSRLFSPARAALLVLGAAALGAVAGCSDPVSVTASELDSHFARWQAAGLRDYRYDFRRSCECAPAATRPATIEVIRGTVARVRFAGDGEELATSEERRFFPTIDQLFELIDDAVRNNAAVLVVSYHPVLGYPTNISIDYRREVADDEFTIQASKLEAL